MARRGRTSHHRSTEGGVGDDCNIGSGPGHVSQPLVGLGVLALHGRQLGRVLRRSRRLQCRPLRLVGREPVGGLPPASPLRQWENTAFRTGDPTVARGPKLQLWRSCVAGIFQTGIL